MRVRIRARSSKHMSTVQRKQACIQALGSIISTVWRTWGWWAMVVGQEVSPDHRSRWSLTLLPELLLLSLDSSSITSSSFYNPSLDKFLSQTQYQGGIPIWCSKYPLIQMTANVTCNDLAIYHHSILSLIGQRPVVTPTLLLFSLNNKSEINAGSPMRRSDQLRICV